MADRHPVPCDRLGDRPQAFAPLPHPQHLPQCVLLVGDRLKRTALPDLPTERRLAAQVAPSLALVAFDLGDALTRALALGLRDGGQIVKTSFDTPLPVTSPPMSIMCRPMPAFLNRASTSSASSAERNMRSSLAVMTISPGWSARAAGRLSVARRAASIPRPRSR